MSSAAHGWCVWHSVAQRQGVTVRTRSRMQVLNGGVGGCQRGFAILASMLAKGARRVSPRSRTAVAAVGKVEGCQLSRLCKKQHA